jgi:very-short-patch-repair endonuclease
MADLVGAPQGNWKERKWFGKIGRYHVDFVICHPKSTRPLLVVEHDDRGHKRRRQRELDEFKDRVLAAAGLPIYRVPAAQAYDPLEIRQNIDRLIASSARARPPKTK